jgi:hypothetical protein
LTSYACSRLLIYFVDAGARDDRSVESENFLLKVGKGGVKLESVLCRKTVNVFRQFLHVLRVARTYFHASVLIKCRMMYL